MRAVRRGDERGQSFTEYFLILFLTVAIFTTVVRVLRPLLSRIAASQGRAIEKRLSEGVYEYRFPGR